MTGSKLELVTCRTYGFNRYQGLFPWG